MKKCEEIENNTNISANKEFNQEEYVFKQSLDLYENFSKNETREQNLNSYRDILITNDFPVVYKGLKFYPIVMAFYNWVNIFAECLIVPHLTCGDVKAIELRYLDFLFYHCLERKKEEDYLIMCLKELLILSLRMNRKECEENNLINFYSKDKGEHYYIKINDIEIDSKDFDTIKEIIAKQNRIELPNEKLHPTFVKDKKELEEYKKRQSSLKICDLSKQISLVSVISGESRKQIINEMSIKTFSEILERYDLLLGYELGILLSPNMKEKDRRGIKHYLDENKKDDYSQEMESIEEIKNKIK